LSELSGKAAFNLEGLPRVVIVGAGFGGIACARALRHAPASITLIDRQNYHVFQPLLYQVATAALSPADIAIPIRAIFRDQFNAKVMLATVTGSLATPRNAFQRRRCTSAIHPGGTGSAAFPAPPS
jgi:NADH dehydrogenase